ncbi:hypothetical protein ABPG75_009217 [Micractinium tetrahymenae]
MGLRPPPCGAIAAEQPASTGASNLTAAALVLAGAASLWWLVLPPSRLAHRRQRHGVLCLLRLAAVHAALAWLPPPEVPLLTAPPGSGPLRQVAAAVAFAAGVEPLLLAVSVLLLPLPLPHHAWVQTLCLRAALSRASARVAAEVATAPPHILHGCSAFVRWARLAVEAVLPGGAVPELPQPADAAQACLMWQLWLGIMLGGLLPTAALAGTQQCRGQLEKLRRWRHLARVGRRGNGHGSEDSSSENSDSEDNCSENSDSEERDGTAESGSDGEGAASACSKASAAARSHAEPLPWVVHPAAQAAASLASWLLLLLPAGAVVWMGLELLAPLLGT